MNEKLQIILPKGSIIPKDIEENIDSVKTLMFELRKAIGERNQLKATHLKILQTIQKRTHGGYH
jgi:hypothetical protein